MIYIAYLSSFSRNLGPATNASYRRYSLCSDLSASGRVFPPVTVLTVKQCIKRVLEE